MIEVPRTVGLIQPCVKLAHGERNRQVVSGIKQRILAGPRSGSYQAEKELRGGFQNYEPPSDKWLLIEDNVHLQSQG